MSGRTNSVGVFGVTGDQVDTFIGQVYTVQLFINDEVQRFGHFVHTLVVLLHVDFFGLQHTGFNALFTQELNQCFVLRQTFVAAVQGEESFFHFFLIVGCDQFFCFGQVLGCQYFLCFLPDALLADGAARTVGRHLSARDRR